MWNMPNDEQVARKKKEKKKTFAILNVNGIMQLK